MPATLIAMSLLALAILVSPVRAQAPGAAEAGTIGVRTGNHPGWGRIVFDAPPNVRYRLTREGNRIVVRFPDGQVLATPTAAPRNVAGLAVAGARLEFSIPAGAGLREMRLGQRLVIDVTDPAARPAAEDPARPAEPADRAREPARRAPPAGEARAARTTSSSPTPSTPSPPSSSQSPSSSPSPSPPSSVGEPVHDRAAAAPRPADRTADQASGQPAGQPVGQPGGQPVGQSAVQPAVPPGGPPGVQASGQPSDRPAGRAAQGSAGVRPLSATEVPPGSIPPTAAAASAAGTIAAPAQPASAPEAPSAEARRGQTARAGETPRPVSAPGGGGAAAPSGSAAVRRDVSSPDRRIAAVPPTADAAQAGPVVATAPRVPVVPDGPSAATGADPVFSTPPQGGTSPAAVPPATVDPVPLRAPGPVALVVRRLPAANPEQSAILIPFPETTGSAMLQRDSATLIVFNERRPLDLAQLRDDPVYGQVTAHVLPNATMLRLPLPEGRGASLTPTAQGWRVMLSNTVPRGPTIRPSFADGRVMFPVAGSAGVVTLRDPDSGATMLIGTVGRGGEAIATERRTVEFILHPTQRGIAVEALSDTLSLRTVPTGFQLTGPPAGLALSPPAAMTNGMLAAARLTRRFRFPAMTTEGLARRANAHVVEAASLPPLARGPARRIAAESLVALGLAAEAEALLRVIVEQDPKEAESADTIMLRAVAALLNGRVNDARPLAEPRAAGTDEDALWRGLLLATRQEGSPEAAQLLASTAPLLLVYPPALRERLLPLAIETMVLGGSLGRAEELLAERPQDPKLRLARAFAHRARDETDAALALLDEETASRDQLVHARAAVQAVEVRLATGALDATAAADALDRLLYAWRGDWRDLALRRRIAELRQHAGAWRTALSILRDAAADFPAQAAQVRGWQQSAFAELVHGDALERLEPLELIGLVEENQDLLPAEEGGDRLRDRLADRLLALDLPKRADPVLVRLMQTAPTELGKAAYGTRLARLRLREGDAEGVLAALGQSSSPELPTEMKEQRLLLAAGAAARMGNPRGAINALNGIDSAAADEVRASVYEQAGDWVGAKRSLASLVRRTVPPEGALDEAHRRLVLRLATAAARVGDDATLAALRDRDTARMGSGPLADMFRLLTAEPVRGTSDLNRARQEVDLARGLPAGLAALAAAPRAD